MAKAVPDRWLNYKAIGERIEGTRFIAFKVPLCEHISKSIDEIDRFDRDLLLKNVPNLGVIIDLTNTHRYYQPNDFIREGVDHFKLMIPGHATPPNFLVKKFKSYVSNFLKNNKDNDKLIGVHCTHGVNRTGYLICNYMISEMTVKPEDAIKRFDNARGHKIERKNYLEALYDISNKNNDAHSSLKRNMDNSTEVTNAQKYTTYKSWREHREPTAVEPLMDRRDRYERCRQDMGQNRTNYNRTSTRIAHIDNRNKPTSNYFKNSSNYAPQVTRNYSTQQRSETTYRYDSRSYCEPIPSKQIRYTSTSNDNNTNRYINDDINTYSSRYRRPQQSSWESNRYPRK